MRLPEIFLIAIGLSMDAFAVSITFGLSIKKPKLIEYLIPGLYFGFFQACMPLIGFFAGTHFAGRIQSFGPWAAFLILGFIGGKMIKESFSKDETPKNSFRFGKMIILAILTSIDALAVGVTFAFFEINIFKAIAIIGVTTFLIAIGGVKVGNICGVMFKSKAGFIGGAVLIVIGLKILIEHLFFTV